MSSGKTASSNGAAAASEAPSPPPVTPPSGFARRRTPILLGLAFLTLVYQLVLKLYPNAEAAPAYCPTDAPCPRPDLLAFQICSGIMQLYMGLTGFTAWHVTKRAHTTIPATPEGRLFGYIEQADRLNVGIFVYQWFDFAASLFIKEHRTAVFLGHHALAGLTAYFSLEYQLVHHYALFFGGCSEFSSIFLVLCDYDVYFPSSHGTTWGLIIFACQTSFAVCFLYYRVIGWIQVSVLLWRDCNYALSANGKVVDKFREGKGWFLRVFLGMDLVLGGLQLYWFGFGILPKIMEILSAEADADVE